MAVTAEDILAHASSMLTTVLADITDRITNEPKRYLRDEPGAKLIGDIKDFVTRASGFEDFSDLADDLDED